MFKIIIVEDDELVREELKILLENSGYEVRCISDFEDVDKKILEEDASLLLLDINLPNKDGYEICSKIRTKSKIPIIIEDNGIGIKKSEIDRIFDKGFTGSNGRLTKKSTGIGLYLCKKLCKELNIEILAESMEGKYTKVTLII